jgi:hypothetical protein
MTRLVISFLVLAAVPVSAGEPARAKAGTKWRQVLTVVGGASGFASGALIGLVAFDDATDSDRKVTTAAIVGAIGGGVAGFLLGKSIDERGLEARAEKAIEDGRRSVQAALALRPASAPAE